MRALSLLFATFLPAAAWAGPCDSLVAKASSAQGDALVSAYTKLATCDAELARDRFPAFMQAAGDLETLVPLTLAAIDTDAFLPVWKMMSQVPYEHRTRLAEEVGEACATHAKVVPFLQGAYVAVKGTAFTSWTPALAACEDPGFEAWLAETIAAPPSSPYNEAYNAVLTAWVERKGAEGLDVLATGAVAAAEGGPFTSVLDAMKRSVEPDSFREEVSPQDQANLEAALVSVAQQVPPEPAKMVLDRLYGAGAEDKAASLLPAVYPDRVTDDGQIRWASAAIEQCDGEAVVHWVSWTEPPTRLDVSAAAADGLRASKARLKCAAEGAWPIRVPTEPLADAEAWVATLVAELEEQGLDVKDREEKKVSVE